MPGAVSGLKKFQKLGYKFIIISNQAGIARGLYSLNDAEKFNRALAVRLAKLGIKIKKVFICPHHPEFTEKCSCRKPEPGLAKLAAKKFNINLQKSIFIGDKDSDIQFGKNCKGLTVLIKNSRYPNNISADLETSDLKEAAKILAQREYEK